MFNQKLQNGGWGNAPKEVSVGDGVANERKIQDGEVVLQQNPPGIHKQNPLTKVTQSKYITGSQFGLRFKTVFVYKCRSGFLE